MKRIAIFIAAMVVAVPTLTAIETAAIPKQARGWGVPTKDQCNVEDEAAFWFLNPDEPWNEAAVSRAKKEENKGEKLRLRIRSYDHRLLDNSAKQIIETLNRHNAKIIGPVPLPTEFKRYTVNRSTFVHKDSREQFELRIHKRLIDVVKPSQSVIESLSDLNLPAGVDVEIKTAV